MAKKVARKKAPPPAAASSGAEELKAFKAAVQDLLKTGKALGRVARLKGNRKLMGSDALRNARFSLSDASSLILKLIPDGTPPPTIP